MVQHVLESVRAHTDWRRDCLNLIASESVASPAVRAILASDLANRYGWCEIGKGVYGGSRYVDEILATTHALARQLFDAPFVELRPTSGNVALLAVLFGLTQPGDVVLTTSPEVGGYPLRIAEKYPIRVHPLPFDFAEMEVELEEALALIHRLRPRMVICGASEFLFPYPVRELAAAARAVGATVVYDGSHVCGLIAGKQFQDPLAEGADVLVTSTHKTLPGPQGGMILSYDGDLMARIQDTLSAPPFLLSAVHLARIAALSVALAEMAAFGREYAAQVVRNAAALARALQAHDVRLFCARKGFTRSHQIILQNGGICSPHGYRLKERLERANIIGDAVVRFGTQEVTRRGMGAEEMERTAALIAAVVYEQQRPDEVRPRVVELARAFATLHYSVNEGEPAYWFGEGGIRQPPAPV